MKIMTTITRFTDAARMLTASVTDAARLLTTSAARTRAASVHTRATRARVLTAALALAGTGTLALIACHPDDVVAPANGEMITLSATAALPGAGITAGGTANRAATRGNSAATTRGDVLTSPYPVYFNGTTEMDIVLNKYNSSGSDDATAYAYTLEAEAEATDADIKPMPAFSTAPDATTPGGITVPSGSNVYLGIPQMKMKLKMKLPTGITHIPGNTNEGSETALVPFHTRMEMPKAKFTASTALALPLTYTTAALRLKLVPGDGARVATVTCPNLPMADAAIRTLTPTRTDGFGEGSDMLPESSDPTQQTVIFGELTPADASNPSTTLAEGNLIALLQLADVTDPSTGTSTPGKLLAVNCPASLASKFKPEAGQMMTLTVHVDATVATITGDVEIDDFTDGNGGGDDGIMIGSSVIGSADAELDANIFNADNPNWKLTGTGTTNVKERLTAIYNNGAGNDTRISLEMPEVTTIGEEAFKQCFCLASISLPKATTIGKQAFYNCTKLTTINLPKATTIEYNTFNNCYSLATIDLPAATEIGANAFSACTDLTTASLPKAAKIGASAFIYCSSLTTIDISEVTDATGIDGNAFNDAASVGYNFVPANCTLILSRTLYDSDDVTSSDGSSVKDTFKGKKWKSITVK